MERSDPSAAAVPGLPDDALVEILLLLPIKPLRKSKCVSKGWRDLIADPLHQKKLPQTLEGFFYGGGDARTDEYSGGYTVRRKPAGYGHFINPLGAPAAAIVDPSFAFLKEVPGITNIRLVGSCNGLLLFEHDVDVERRIVRYIVCNPATEELVTIPVDWTPESVEPWWRDSGRIYLIFCPDISSHFHIVKLWEKMTSIEPNLLVHVYSSETKAWSCRLCVWSDRYIVESGFVIAGLGSAFVNGMLYLHAFFDDSEELVVATNLEGNQWKIIPAPLRVGDEDTYYTHYVGPSQGRLHYIYHAHADDVEQEYDAGGVPSELSSNFNTSNFDDWGGNIKEVLLIWVLEDYDTERWVLKHTVSFLELFGKKVIPMDYRYSVVAIHPDCNLVFIVQHWNQKLISYNMDSREVCDLCTLPHDYGKITPYVPYFSKLASLENKQ